MKNTENIKSDWEKRFEDFRQTTGSFQDPGGYVQFNRIKAFISQEIHQAEQQTAKAYGGCTRCYGKGYSTEIVGTQGFDDFRGEAFQIAPSEQMNFCTCERGKNLKEKIQQACQQAVEEIKKKVGKMKIKNLPGR